MKNSFVMYTNQLKQIEALSYEQAGVLLVALMRHASGKEIPEMDGMTYMAFLFISDQIDRDNAKYQEAVNAHKEAGKKGGRPKKQNEENQMVLEKPNGFNENQTKHNNENDNVNENDIKEKSSDEDKKKKPSESLPDEVSPLSRFEDFWSVYPASDTLPVTAKRRTETAYAVVSAEGFQESDLITSAENYAEAVRIEAREARYIKRPERFLSDGTYKDYLPESYVKPEAIRKKPTAADRYNSGIMQRDVDFDALERELLGKGG